MHRRVQICHPLIEALSARTAVSLLVEQEGNADRKTDTMGALHRVHTKIGFDTAEDEPSTDCWKALTPYKYPTWIPDSQPRRLLARCPPRGRPSAMAARKGPGPKGGNAANVQVPSPAGARALAKLANLALG